MRVWQSLFAILVLAALSYAVYLKGQFSIETGLADVAPEIADSVHTQQAISSLRSNIEKRILILVSGTDEDSVYEAADQLTDALSATPELTLLPDGLELVDELIEQLKPYRFKLLSQSQLERIDELSQSQLVEQAQAQLYSLSNTPIYPFSADPFGVNSASLFEVLQRLQSNTDASDSNYHQSLSLLIEGDALSMGQQAILTAKLENAITSVLNNHPVQIDRSGVFFFASHAAQESKRDISLISTVSIVGVVALLLFVFRSLIALLLPVTSVATGVGFAFAAVHAVYGQVHVLTIVFGASLIGIVIDYSLHYFYHSSTQLSAGADQERSSLHRALLLSLCTSLIGYAALSFSGLEALKKVALFSCCGLAMAWLSVMCFGERATRKGFSTESSGLSWLVRTMQNSLLRLPKLSLPCVATVVLLVSASVWFLSKPVSDDPRVFFTAPEHLLASERRVAEVANDYEPGQYLLLLGNSVVEIQERFRAMQAVIKDTNNLDINSFSSVFSLVPTIAEQDLAYAMTAKLYGESSALGALASQLSIDPATVSALRQEYSAAANRYLNPETVNNVLGQALPPMWFVSDDTYVGFVLIKKGVNADVLSSKLAGIEGVEYVNTLKKTQSALQAQRESASTLLFLAYVLVMGLLVARFKSASAAWMVVVPLVSSAMLLLLAPVFGYALNLFHIMALFLVLGFGMDYTIFVREMQDHQAKTLEAILLSAITSLLSFGLLALSSIPVVASFGLALLIGNSMNLLGAFAYSRAIR